MIKIGIYGAKGRMGKQIKLCLEDEKDAKASAFFNQNDDIKIFFQNCEVVIDFSSANGTKELLTFARTDPKPLVIGTTGLDEKTFELLKSASEIMPVFYATNMSLGVAVLNHFASKISALLESFDIEILEMHHRHKKDSPSGTAMTLAQSVAKARNLDLEKVRVGGRDGILGERSKDEIAVMSLRGGDIVGRHTIGFYEEGEYLELTHTATSRATFAKGAIKIAKWLVTKDPKLYSINDFLRI